MRRSWFEGKKCLDVGCNEGHLTLALVRSFRPRRMVGLDIDRYLVRRARKVNGGVCTNPLAVDLHIVFRFLEHVQPRLHLVRENISKRDLAGYRRC